MLEYFKVNDLVNYPDSTPNTWQEAIEVSCEKLLNRGYISNTYIEEIIKSVKEYGPYIVILPNIAMPHAEGNFDSVYKSGISFTKFKQPVKFFDEKEGLEKPEAAENLQDL